MAFSNRSGWIVAAILIFPSLIPVLVGVGRLFSLATGTEFLPEHADLYEAMPLPIGAHIIGATLFCVLGAFQVAPGFRQHHPRWHRLSGRVLVPAGITAALSGLWMATYYAGVNSDLLYSFRIVFGLLWVVFLGIGVAAILRRDIATHRAFMIRSFAIALGASTQALIFIPVAAMGIEPSDLGSDLLMGAAWGINLLLAEWIIRGRPGLARPVKAAVGG